MKPVLLTIAAVGLLTAQDFHVGSPVAEFSLRDLDGRSVAYSELKGSVTVVAFISTQCPVSNAYNDRMNALYKEFSSRVKFVFVNSNANESADEVRRHARDAGFEFPVYKDVNNVVANRFGAQATPETFVMDGDGVIRYHGYVEDAQNPARVKNPGLKLAIQAVLDGKAVATPETKAFGCTIKKVRRTSE
jgi:peroxiredoxin